MITLFKVFNGLLTLIGAILVGCWLSGIMFCVNCP